MAKFEVSGWKLSLVLWWICGLVMIGLTNGMSPSEKEELRLKVVEMFDHAYGSYMDNAYPADELMPLSCKGRHRGTQPSRGDVDDVLGNFSLTLVDTLDTLAVMGKTTEFEDAVRLVIRDVTFDSDIVVSVFETNIRILGGLVGGHVMATYYKKSGRGFAWYKDELLEKAKDVGYRLLPAFNTTTGIPYPRVNLRYGLRHGVARTGHERDTCTSCAGTMILEFAALSRLSGEPIFEEKARKAMNFLWKQRHRSSDLVGTVINIHTGDWIRRESGVGAGIDSYYEYLLKAYIMLGDETYLDRFNKHYDAVMKYVSQGPMLVDVHMHKPLTNSRNFMDALLAFWPGLQVLKGDIKPAIEMHEMLYQVMQRHNFLPEAFTTDFRVHWAQHPLRPEFIESTYFLYKATSDPYYLHVGKTVIDKLEQHARVQCGYAALKDVTSGRKEDQMDSFVLAEMFKYLFLLFAEPEDLVFDVDDYIFTTEAHMLPLSLSVHSTVPNITDPIPPHVFEDEEDEGRFLRSCPNTNHLFPGNANYAHSIRSPLKNMVESVCPKPRNRKKPPLRASEFIAGNKEQLEHLRKMGIRIVTMKDGRVQLLHTAAEAESPEDAEAGMLFMQDMIDLSKQQATEVQQDPRIVQLLSHPHLGNKVLNAGPAQFGYDLKISEGLYGVVIVSPSIKGCQPLENVEDVKGKILLLERGDCMFIDKARHIEAAGALAGIVMDHNEGTSSDTAPLFAMSGDGKNDVQIPMVFLFNREGRELREAIGESPGELRVFLGLKALTMDKTLKYLMREKQGLDESTVQQSSEANTGVKPPEIHRTSNNAYVKKLDIGQIQLQFTKRVPWTKESENLMDMVEGRRPATDDIVTMETNNKMGEVLDEVVILLKQHTNFKSLETPSYLKAIGDVVEAAFQGPENPQLNYESQNLLDKLGLELKANDEAEVISRVKSEVSEDDVSVALVRKNSKTTNSFPRAPKSGASIKEEVRQAPGWMNLKEGELYVSKEGVLYVSDLQRFRSAQGVVTSDVIDKVQEDAHTIIFGDKESDAPSIVSGGQTGSGVTETGSGVSETGSGEAGSRKTPSTVGVETGSGARTGNDATTGSSDLHSSSRDASSHDSETLNTADSEKISANDDIIITQHDDISEKSDTKCEPGTSAQGESSKKCDKVAQEGGMGSSTNTESRVPTVAQPEIDIKTGAHSSEDSGYDSDPEYTVNAADVHHFTKDTAPPPAHPDSAQKTSQKDSVLQDSPPDSTPVKNTEKDSGIKDEL